MGWNFHTSHPMAMRLSVAVFLALFYTGHASENHPQVYFVSRNFQHILHWEKQNSSTGKPVLYSVQYIIYGHQWQEKAECQNITVLSCDLSAEMKNTHEYYYSRVTADGAELGVTPRFRPMDDTVLGPPIVSVLAGAESLDLTVRLPTGPDNRTSLEDLIKAGLQGRVIQYTARINSSDGAVQENRTSSAIITFNHLKNNRRHCGTVSYTYAVRSQSEAFEFCVRTLQVSDPSVIIAGSLLGGRSPHRLPVRLLLPVREAEEPHAVLSECSWKQHNSPWTAFPT
ncbi:interleukin-20 receptor subunit alpha-like [Megalops cyprinoides]|uniref:interleukin-20 receptor subunit alpha-like n=1 Tax=Megalops cyprinoides TaxID=118141 RepID=UPI001864C8AA|nr:interleukin-20 receptor subunit alpha-like [Megalops cyprinoides]